MEHALASGEPAGLSAADLGSQVHALLAGNPSGDIAPEARRLAEVFLQSPLGRRAARATRIAREFDFVMALEDLVVSGQVDLWFEEGGELVVADYKTDDVTAAEARHRARDYALQLRLYALAVERVAGRAPDRAFVHFLRPNVVVEVDLTPTLIESPEQTVRDFQEAQSKLDFPLSRRRALPAVRLLPRPLSGGAGAVTGQALTYAFVDRHPRLLMGLQHLLEHILRQAGRNLHHVAAGSHGHRFDQRLRRRVLTRLHLRQIDQQLDHVAERRGVLCGVALRFAAEHHLAPNFTPPAAVCTFCATFSMGLALALAVFIGGARLAGGTVVMPQASCELLHWLTFTRTAAGRGCGIFSRSIAPLTLAISPATTVVESRKAMPMLCFLGSSRMVMPL